MFKSKLARCTVHQSIVAALRTLELQGVVQSLPGKMYALL
jgi:hypothetical protein